MHESPLSSFGDGLEWLLAIACLGGLLGFVVFLILGIIRRKPVWWILMAGSLVLAIATFIPLAFIAAKAWADGAEKFQATMSNSESLEAEGKEVICAAREVKLHVPPNWSDLTEMMAHEDASLQIGNLMREQYLIVIPETRVEIVETFGEENTFEEYCTMVANHVTEAGEQAVIVSSSDGGLDGVNHSKRIEITGIYTDMPLRYVIYLVDAGEYFHQFMFWSTEAKAKDAVPVFDAVARTYSKVE